MATLNLYRRADGLLEAGDDETLEYIGKTKIGQQIIARTPDTNTGTIPMLRTWRGWMRETAAWMAWNGARMPLVIRSNGEQWGSRAFDENDAHELFTAKWLGVDEKGVRYSWRMRGESDQDSTPAPKSKRLFAMELHESWCTERGIKITIPENSEYRKFKLEQIK